MTTSSPPLFAPREPIFPRRVSGRFRRLKWIIMAVTLGIYYLTPWIRWDRGPALPDQAVLIDLAHRRFYFFFIEIWPHEFYFVAGLLIMAGLGLFLFTSALGRVWCGYACPQTVWTDLFILVERWIEGDRNARIRLWRQSWDLQKWRLRVTKWLVWLVIALGTGGAWVFYFADAPTLLQSLFTLSAPPVAWASIAVLTATTFVFGGFMREQVCNYMCPWPRIQAAMMDDDSITVAYRSWRGEPRGKHRKGARASAEARVATPYAEAEALDIDTEGLTEAEIAARVRHGDCIDCMACVNVCPAGIDIRDGQQLECITCALCIDACDEMMDRIGQPRGLIAYLALSDEPKERAGAAPIPVWRHVLRPRTVLYTALWSLIGVGLLIALLIRSDIDLTIAPVRNPSYVLQPDGSVRNIYDVRLRNMNGNDRHFQVTIDGAPDILLEMEGAEGDSVTVNADQMLVQRLYLTAAPGTDVALGSRRDVTLRLTEMASGESTTTRTTFTGTGEQQ